MRLALISGSPGFGHGYLPNVQPALETAALELTQRGFRLISGRPMIFTSAVAFDAAVEAFLSAANSDEPDVSIFYFSGHGVQFEAPAGPRYFLICEAGASLNTPSASSLVDVEALVFRL